MNGSMQHQVDIPLIPAFLAFMCGLMMGVMIGRRKAMMHGMQGGGECGGGMMRHKMMGPMGMMGMMGPMGMHHHHGDGMPQCTCGEGGESAGHGREHKPSE
jgi:hypothetical protein